jgi:hypothetical protein
MAGSATKDNKALYGIITSAVSLLRDHELLGPRVLRRWLPAGTWVEALRMSRLIDDNFHIDAGKFKKAMACGICTRRISMLKFNLTTRTAVFFK